MSEDYDEILEQTVDEIKQSVREMDDADYEALLKLEKGGKDRKTVKEFLQDKVDTEEVELEEKEMDEIVEDIEEETSGGILGSFDRTQVLAGGVIAGIIIGLLAGFAFNMDSTTGDRQLARDSLNQLFEQSGSEAEIVNIEEESGVYAATVNRTITNPLTNQTQEVSQTLFVSKDGKYLFQGSTFEELQQLQRQRQQQANTREQTGNTTQ